MSSRPRNRLNTMGPPFDLAFVEALLRRQLCARHHGRVVRLRNVPDELRCLLELLGLDEVVVVQPRGQAEPGEQLRVDEVVKPGDAVA
jgi:hypothetical protein